MTGIFHRTWFKDSRQFYTMAEIGHLQTCLEDIFEEFTPKFLNKSHCIQLQYKVQSKKKRILVFVRVFRKQSEKAILKSAMYIFETRDLHFLQAYLAGLVSTLAV